MAVVVAAAIAAPGAAAQSSLLSRGFEAGSPLSRGTQVPTLWCYRPSDRLRYDRLPAGASQAYRPSLRGDPYDGLDLVDRGQRFGPLPEWPYRFDSR